jgi:ribonuclease P protein component
MLPKEKRIPRKMFPLLSNGTKVFKNNLFLLRFVVKIGLSSRFCFSVSKKVAKNAVARNKMRRAGYLILERHLSDIKPNVLALFSFRTIPKNDDEIIKNLEAVLKESKLIN